MVRRAKVGGRGREQEQEIERVKKKKSGLERKVEWGRRLARWLGSLGRAEDWKVVFSKRWHLTSGSQGLQETPRPQRAVRLLPWEPRTWRRLTWWWLLCAASSSMLSVNSVLASSVSSPVAASGSESRRERWFLSQVTFRQQLQLHVFCHLPLISSFLCMRGPLASRAKGRTSVPNL